MDERQLRILRELGDLGSVSAVAEALHVTPSAISQQLRLLQRSIPVPLTERAGRRVVLTDAGHALAAAAIEVESALARARHAVADFAEQPAGVVSVAAFHSAASAFFPRLLHGLSGPEHPRLALADEDVAQDRFPALTRDHDLVLRPPPRPRPALAAHRHLGHAAARAPRRGPAGRPSAGRRAGALAPGRGGPAVDHGPRRLPADGHHRGHRRLRRPCARHRPSDQ